MAELSRAGKIREAAAYIEKHGWRQGQAFETSAHYNNDLGRVDYSVNLERGEKCCTWGALVAHGVRGTADLADHLRIGHGAEGFGSDLDIWDWNDAAGRTKEEVVQALHDWADAVEESDAQSE